MGKIYICPHGCKMNRDEVKVVGNGNLRCPVHGCAFLHIEVLCNGKDCGAIMIVDMKKSRIDRCEACKRKNRLARRCAYNAKYHDKIKISNRRAAIVKKFHQKIPAKWPPFPPVRFHDCVYYDRCLSNLDWKQPTHKFNCAVCACYIQKPPEDPADYIGSGTNRPDFLPPAGGRAYSTGRR
jgi:hypothetical protein